jgi:hypothetical protein
MQKTHTLILVLLFTLPVIWGQTVKSKEPVSPKEAIQKVFNVLSKKEGFVPDSAALVTGLQNGAWEALAYLNAATKDSLSKADLQEAVPDYYRFYSQELLLKLINQKDYNSFGQELKVPYRLIGNEIILLNPQDGSIKDRWTILYLDSFYLALDYGDLRVFFVQTATQE